MIRNYPIGKMKALVFLTKMPVDFFAIYQTVNESIYLSGQNFAAN